MVHYLNALAESVSRAALMSKQQRRPNENSAPTLFCSTQACKLLATRRPEKGIIREQNFQSEAERSARGQS